MSKTTINPYLHFEGEAKEALEFYKEALGGEVVIKKYGDAPMETPEEMKDRVMYGVLTFGDAKIMASDAQEGQIVSYGSANSILVDESDMDKADSIFDKLSDDGTITMPFEVQFWGGKLGSLIDKFGIYWMVSCEPERK